MDNADKEECYICGKLCNPRFFQAHLRSHTNLILYDCYVCGARYSTSNGFNEHMKLHQTHLMCEDCGKRFLTVEHFKEHECYFKYKNHVCHYCEKAFYSNNDLVRHLRSHTLEKPFSCDECGKSFSQKCNRDYHLRLHIKNPDIKPVKPEEDFICEICLKAFRYKLHLQNHILTHTGEKPHLCNICHKGFIQKWQLKLHMEKHSDEMKYKCNECDKSFKLRLSYEAHKKSHQEPYIFCTQCDKAFNQTYKYQRHYDKVHLKVKPYICDICHKAFYNPTLLKSHYIAHTKQNYKLNSQTDESACDPNADKFDISRKSLELPYKKSKSHKCEICGERFYRFDSLRKHSFSHKVKRLEIKLKPIDNSTENITNASKVNSNSKNQQNPSSHTFVNQLNPPNQKFKVMINIQQFDANTDKGGEILTESLIKPKCSSENNLFKCHLCKNSFKSKRFLVKHHTKFIKEFLECCLCGKNFDYVEDLTEHHKCHENSSNSLNTSDILS